MKKEADYPKCIEAEKEVLSAMLLEEGAAIPKVSSIINEEDFYRPEHKIIYSTLLKLYNSGDGTKLCLLSLLRELERVGKLREIGIDYLYMLDNVTFTTAYVSMNAKEVKEKSILRQLMILGEQISSEAYNGRFHSAEIIEHAERRLLELAPINNRTSFESVSQILHRSFERIQHIQNNPNVVEGITSGLVDLDKITNGFQKPDLILLAARPSMGKTALALKIAVSAALKKKVVALFSLEMSKTQLGNRLLSAESKVNSLYLNTGNLVDNDLRELIKAHDRLSKATLFIDDTAGISSMMLRSKVQRLKQEQGLDFIVIDYLQLMQGQKFKNLEINRQQEISEISRNLKTLARELDVPILALSQLSRNVELRAEKKPQLSDLRESGSLEQDADIVMFLYRDEYYHRDDSNSQNIAELIIAKNRNGPTTSIHIQFNKEIMLFSDLTEATQ